MAFCLDDEDVTDVQWIWENPESEWAISRGKSAAEEFQSLVDRKSRPNWKICIKTYIA